VEWKEGSHKRAIISYGCERYTGSVEKMPTKFMQSLDPQVYAELRKIAKERGITMQELIRAVIVPDWMRKDESPRGSSRRSRTVRSAAKRIRAKITA
jgi:hypothetical protein